MEAFVYRWRNIKNKMWYIGYHKGHPNDGYICSSKIAKPLIKFNSNEWVRKIIRTGTVKDMMALERRILGLLDAKRNLLSLNKTNGSHAFGGRPKETRNKVRPNTLLEETCKRICGKSYWTLLLEDYIDSIVKEEWYLVRKYETQILKKILGFTPNYRENAKYLYDGK